MATGHSGPLSSSHWPGPHRQSLLRFHGDTDGLLPNLPGPYIYHLFNDCLPLSPVLGTEIRAGQQTELNPLRMSPCHLGDGQQVGDTPHSLHKGWGRQTRFLLCPHFKGRGLT